MTNSDYQSLLNTTELEKSEFENMIDILIRKQKAIERLDTAEIQSIVREEFQQLNRIQGAEKARVSTIGSLGLKAQDLGDAEALAGKLGRERSATYAALHSAFRKVHAQVVQLNSITNALLVHSIAFIKQNIRILTDNGNRKLVDKKA